MRERDDVAAAAAELATGGPVVVCTPDGGGSLVAAAGGITTERMAFLVRHTSGFLCVALTGDDCERLALPRMHAHDPDHPPVADFRVSVDAAEGISTGISAHDRARTARLLADAGSTPRTFVRPGHVIPVAAASGGVLQRPGAAEAGVDLCGLADLPPVAVYGQLVSAEHPERMAGPHELRRFAREHGAPLVDVAALVALRLATRSRQSLSCPHCAARAGRAVA